jgi:hypothetical protein
MANKILYMADVTNIKYVIWQDEMTVKHARLAGHVAGEWVTFAAEDGRLRPLPANPWLAESLEEGSDAEEAKPKAVTG